MTLPQQIARQFREMYFGPSFTGSYFKEHLEGLTYQQATTSIHELNSIALLVFHINYYVSAVLQVLKGGSLDAHDKYSYDMSPIESQEDWEKLLAKFWVEAEEFATLVEQMPEEQLSAFFEKEKYGNYFRNLIGMIEHTHYHLGQIAIIKKMVATT